MRFISGAASKMSRLNSTLQRPQAKALSRNKKRRYRGDDTRSMYLINLCYVLQQPRVLALSQKLQTIVHSWRNSYFHGDVKLPRTVVALFSLACYWGVEFITEWIAQQKCTATYFFLFFSFPIKNTFLIQLKHQCSKQSIIIQQNDLT